MEDYELEELNTEESESLTKDMQAILEKYNCEMGVKSSIFIMKRVPKTDGIQTQTTEKTNKTSDSV